MTGPYPLKCKKKGFGRIRGCSFQVPPRFARSDCQSHRAPSAKKSPAGDCASGLELLHANHVFMQFNFARVTDIATVFKSLLDTSSD